MHENFHGKNKILIHFNSNRTKKKRVIEEDKERERERIIDK
jgi:hypothetical protein